MIDEIVVPVIPIVLGQGLPLFAGVCARYPLTLLNSRPIGAGMVQLTYTRKP